MGDGFLKEELLLFQYIFDVRNFNQEERRLKVMRTAIRFSDDEDILKRFPELGDMVDSFFKNPEMLDEMRELENTREDKIMHLSNYMRLFLVYTLPKALWKREFDLPLNYVEKMLLQEIIPHTTAHPFWNLCIEKVTKHVLYIAFGLCRTCGSPKTKIKCLVCNMVKFCSIKCKKHVDSIFGHNDLDCKYLELYQKSKKK